MITADQVLAGRDTLLAATGHHPYARHALWRDHDAHGWRRDGAVGWLLPESFPTTTSRPGDPRIVDWYGIHDGDRLVACGADRSRGDVGFLAGLTVATDRRGRGLGAALTAGMTRALFARYDHVALGVYTDNVGAIRLYRRLGYTDTEPRTSVHLG
ncbi:GNAT family N-acetyltransferase [Micromonospora narathiwatensis]|uniref:FR47-like protein n=1 Tax=Micromonospora narathiwatensis TaxID=299146 RepID=A0A1A8Z7M8_9ACTN|nr:GNAT family N-acetyltransferase [Micromonospora narathiwatensis]SBT39856.1 FR47-like protein [Micromonospora narathiwatensis]